MIPYSIHVAILLTVCFVFYKLLLQKETYYSLNRVVLLSCLMLAFVLPLISVPQQFSFRSRPSIPLSVLNTYQPTDVAWKEAPSPATPVIAVKQHKSETAIAQKPANNIATIKMAPPVVSLTDILFKWGPALYWCITGAFLLNFLVQVMALLYQAYKNPAIRDGVYRIIELADDKAPCSFGKFIFINPSKYDWETYNQILMHEKVHIQQGHSFDLLVAELMLVVQWFNPFAWLYRKELESNLEFLTDNAVLHDNEVAVADYQMSLLRVSVPNLSMRITTNYNQSLLKKRIIMMNAKRSNVHTMWKYFMLVPLLMVLVCGLNKPIAMSSPAAKSQQKGFTERNSEKLDWSHGTWFATIKGDKVYVQFEADDNDEHHSWSSSHNFSLSDFPNLPKTDKADFTLTREAGSVVFNGRFDGDQGLGHYKFTPNKDYIAFMAKQSIAAKDDDEYFSYFMADVKKEYVQFLRDNGFKDIPRYQVMSMASQKIDAAYIKYWKELGYQNLSPNELVSLKSQKVDAAYVNDIRKAGYTNLTVRELISFHQQGITGDYINGLKKANVALPGVNAAATLTPREVITSKNMHVDSGYVATMRKFGHGNNFNELTTLKSLNVTPEYIKSFEDVGFKDIPPSTLISMKRDDITPEYVKAFKDMGYSDGDIGRLVQLKRIGVTPDYVKSLNGVGYTSVSVGTLSRLAGQKITPQDIKEYQGLDIKGDKDINPHMPPNSGFSRIYGPKQDPAAKQDMMPEGALPINAIANFKQQGITPEYIKGFEAAGYKNIPYHVFDSFKQQGITPEYIKSFEAVGYKAIPYESLGMLKSRGVTPEYVKGFQSVGYNSIPYNSLVGLKLQGITPEYVKSFQDVGYKDIPYNYLITFKLQGITPEFVKGFQGIGYNDIHYPTLIGLKSQSVTPEFVTAYAKLGFTNIRIEDVIRLKADGVTPEFINEMKQKGFDSKDINKYIQLKNFNSETGNMPGQKIRVMPATIINK